VVSLAARQGCARRACTPRLRLVATACSAAAVVSKQPPRGMEVVLFLSVMCMCLICLCLRVVDVWYLGLLLIDISWPHLQCMLRGDCPMNMFLVQVVCLHWLRWFRRKPLGLVHMHALAVLIASLGDHWV